MSTAPKRRWLQFGLRGLSVSIVVVALMIWGGQAIVDRYYSIPLSTETASFNARAATDPIGALEPLLTEDEVIRSIESQLPTLEATEQVKSIYRRIIRTHRLPEGAALHATSGYSPSKNTETSTV